MDKGDMMSVRGGSGFRDAGASMGSATALGQPTTLAQLLSQCQQIEVTCDSIEQIVDDIDGSQASLPRTGNSLVEAAPPTSRIDHLDLRLGTIYQRLANIVNRLGRRV